MREMAPTAMARLVLYGTLAAQVAVGQLVQPASVLEGLGWVLLVYLLAAAVAFGILPAADDAGGTRVVPAVVMAGVGYLGYQTYVWPGSGGLGIFTLDWRFTAAVCFIGPALEESVYRGRAFGSLLRRQGAVLTIIETAAVFVLVHVVVELSVSAWLLRALYGVVFGVARVWGGSVYASMLCHVLLSCAIVWI